MKIRVYSPKDCEEIAKLFYNTVHYINAKDYSKKQLNVWATGNIDKEAWNKSFMDHYTLVAIIDEKIVGFGDIDNRGYLDRLYSHKDYQGLGVATEICNRLEKYYNVNKITTHASITAKGFFEERGYKVIKAQQVERGSENLINYVMEKCLN